MDVMERRHQLLANADVGYVRNGLILWMDGVKKGDTAGAWVDRVAGHVFTAVNGFTDGGNYVGIDGTQYFTNSSFPAQNAQRSTIEAVIKDYSSGGILYMPKGNGIAFGVRNNGYEILSAAGNSSNAMVVFSAGTSAFSINSTTSLLDGISGTFSNNNAWSNFDGYNYIGRRNNGSNSNFFTGKIYAIRIYNRLLTEDEMLHNQRIDNQRYKLELNI